VHNKKNFDQKDKDYGFTKKKVQIFLFLHKMFFSL